MERRARAPRAGCGNLAATNFARTDIRCSLGRIFGTGFRSAIANGSDRVFLRSQIAELGLGRFLGRLRRALVRALASLLVWLRVHTDDFRSLEFCRQGRASIGRRNHRWPGSHHHHSPAEDSAEDEERADDRPRAGPFTEREHDPERIQRRLEERNERRLESGLPTR